MIKMRLFSFFLEVILTSRFTQPISTGIQAADERNCSFLHEAEIEFFGSSSPCLRTCKKANHKCKICQKKTGRGREICFAVHKRKYVNNCDNCMKNPHGLTKDEIERIISLNDLKQGSISRKE